ncbi:MAG: BolA/IbaG family iron-sulfur metabolism protein [Kistimonas sp.]|nr:BolA/IbaG family iron-sulfur metabolism protein [Kistimonas sp.]
MLANEIKQCVAKGLEGAEVHVEGEGCALSMTVISASFAGLSPVRRQQLVYSFLGDRIADGSLHAVNLRLFTAEEWSRRTSSRADAQPRPTGGAAAS